jgi:tetratricopeptide (TPR) repeat protein
VPFVLGSQAIPLASAVKVRDSQAAVVERDGDRALDDAVTAVKLQPWAASTHLQLALVHEQLGELEEARDAVRTAIARDESDWRLWFVAARIETKLGEIEDALGSLDRAALNPRSAIFAGRE